MRVLASAVLPEQVGSVVLSASLRDLALTLAAEHRGETVLRQEVDARVLSTGTAGGFVGTVAGPFAHKGGRLIVGRVEYLPVDAATVAPLPE